MKKSQNRHIKSLISGAFFAVLLVFMSALQSGCFRPVAALSFVNKDDGQEQVGAKRGKLFTPQVDPATQWSLQRYGSIVQKYSAKYDLDWRLVLALIKHESRFSSTAMSHRGAFGLMQIMPGTRSELAEELGVQETETPYNNIKVGTFFLRRLYASFDKADEENRTRLTLAAYNAGLNRILDAQEIAAYLGDDPNSWESVKAALPLLSKRYYTLHERIWDGGKPRAGYFSDWRQTQNYVESIMAYYDGYQVALR